MAKVAKYYPFHPITYIPKAVLLIGNTHLVLSRKGSV